MKICPFANGEFYDVVSDDGRLIERFNTIDAANDYVDGYYADIHEAYMYPPEDLEDS